MNYTIWYENKSREVFTSLLFLIIIKEFYK